MVRFVAVFARDSPGHHHASSTDLSPFYDASCDSRWQAQTPRLLQCFDSRHRLQDCNFQTSNLHLSSRQLPQTFSWQATAAIGGSSGSDQDTSQSLDPVKSTASSSHCIVGAFGWSLIKLSVHLNHYSMLNYFQVWIVLSNFRDPTLCPHRLSWTVESESATSHQCPWRERH